MPPLPLRLTLVAAVSVVALPAGDRALPSIEKHHLEGHYRNESFLFLSDSGGGRTASPGVGGPAAASAPTVVTRPGRFFTAVEQASRYDVPIPMPAGASYARATITFDVSASGFPGPALHTILEMINLGQAGHGGRYFAIQHTVRAAEKKGIRTNVDNLMGGFRAVRTDVLETVRSGGASLRYRVVYDTSARSVTVEITDCDSGAGDAFTVSLTNEDEAPLVEEDGIRGTGEELVVRLGLDRTYDHGGYFPPYGWSFSDLVIELEEARR